MKILNKLKFVEGMADIEKVFLLEIENQEVYLRADMEYGGEYQQPRIEMMNFCLDKSKPILETSVDCRSLYIGGISFIEYNVCECDSTQRGIEDFIEMADSYKAVYIECENCDLENIARYMCNGFCCVNVV